MTGSAEIVQGDARDLPFDDATVDLIVTSPPYFGLRSYTDDGAHYSGQLGDEATPAEFVDALIGVTVECVRVLKPTGSLWVNLGDKYDPAKSLTGIPWRYAIRCVDDLGLILRAEVVWSKPNGLPESVTDRVRRSHETWFHFTLNPSYFSATDEVRETYAPATAARYAQGYAPTDYQTGQVRRGIGVDYSGRFDQNPLGKLPGSVWTIPTEPLTVPDRLGVDHFAAFPTELPRRIIAGWSPEGVCVTCGQGRRPAIDRRFTGEPNDAEADKQRRRSVINGGVKNVTLGRTGQIDRRIVGYVCRCTPRRDHPGDRVPVTERTGELLAVDPGNAPRQGTGALGDLPRSGPWTEYLLDDWSPAPTTPGVVLDPFGGTGTTALVAKALGRRGVSVDLSADYCRLAEWRVNDRRELAKAMRVERPAPIPDDQMSLLDDL